MRMNRRWDISCYKLGWVTRFMIFHSPAHSLSLGPTGLLPGRRWNNQKQPNSTIRTNGPPCTSSRYMDMSRCNLFYVGSLGTLSPAWPLLRTDQKLELEGKEEGVHPSLPALLTLFLFDPLLESQKASSFISG